MNTQVADSIKDYFRTKPIEKAWLFGSYARNEETESSDVDILVSFVPGTKMGLKYFGMIIDLEDRLQKSVDLVVEGDLLPFAKETADRDKILIYERDC